jgi:hypothetical protein
MIGPRLHTQFGAVGLVDAMNGKPGHESNLPAPLIRHR